MEEARVAVVLTQGLSPSVAARQRDEIRFGIPDNAQDVCRRDVAARTVLMLQRLLRRMAARVQELSDRLHFEKA